MTEAITVFADHLRVSIRLTPNGSRDRIEGLERSDDGESHLKAKVTAVPEDGKANKALVQLLAKQLRVPKSSIAFVAGETSRKKILRIDGDPEDLKKRFNALLAP